MSDKEKPIVAQCPFGGYAPCIDDLCRGGGETLCGLEEGSDFCCHGFIPETCPQCREEDDDGEEFYGDE